MRIYSLTPVVVAISVYLCACRADENAAKLTWKFTDNKAALCNDFTRAGFFHRNTRDAVQKWVVFLESGILCYSNETCNRRYFQSHIRERYSTEVTSGFGNFDTGLVWEKTGAAGQPLAEVVNPLMTSIYCFRNETAYFRSDGRDITIEGRDILSTDCTENPTFCNHGHVLVPYCSSDMWLGTEDETSRQYSSLLKEEPCDCWDQDCFRYNPTSDDLQFTFRGQTIFRSVLQTLDSMYNLHEASEIVLVGSSAGGVGVLNSAKWMREEYRNVSIKVIADSSWFIDFRDSINQEFGTFNQVSVERSRTNILFLSNEACSDTRFGYPCCFLAQCLLQERSTLTGETYYPHDVPLFTLTSVYDVFLLSNTLTGLVPLQNSGISITGLAVEFLTIVGEYGGAMNSSLTETSNAASLSNISFSFYAPQCFQHVYLASSSLQEEDGLLGSEALEYSQNVATFRHTVQSGVWSSHVLAYYEGQGYTIRDAIHYWYWNVSDREKGLVFRDLCSGPYCTNSCPDELFLEEENADIWPDGAKIVIAGMVLAIAVGCIVMKVYCCLWYKLLHRSQQTFLTGTELRMNEDQYNVNGEIREFPYCTDDEAISVACLDLHYSVSSHTNVLPKPDTHIPATLISSMQEESSSTSGDSIEHVNLEDSHSPSKQNRIKKSILGTKRSILNGISAYFNPGELIAIMGPSGSGKTTFLDILTGRRKSDSTVGNIFINGLPLEENRKWYINNTGYVLQLAAPYYEELTVRENLTLAAWVKLHISSREKFQRVEQVMEVTGLLDLADTVVGGATGPGLSGGQKRRLVVALQLLKLPSVLFLDEPTSGLDSASAVELLTHLNTLAASNRTVVLTIHQPRLEIFHMFHRIVVLTDGKVAYQGVPEKAYEVFVNALHSCLLCLDLDIPPLEDHNPADVIMDMLGNQKMRNIVNSYYEDSGEPELVRKAVAEAQEKEQFHCDHVDGSNAKIKNIREIFHGNRQAGRSHNYSILRLAALEARAMKRSSFVNTLYLPFIFFAYGFLLGTVYFQTSMPFLVMSGFCVYSVASALFMFPAMYTFYTRAMEIYTFEHADGAGRATDLVIQPFVRFISMAFFPVIICAGLLYLLLVDKIRWNLLEFLQIALVNVALNQVWVALTIWLILTFPLRALRINSMLAAIAGFTSGFFIPISDIPWGYRWLCYINPNFYGFSASTVILLSDFQSDCEINGGSELECYTSSGKYILDSFSFNDINPYQNIVILMSMTIFFLVMAVLSNWVRYVSPDYVTKRFKFIVKRIILQSESDLALSKDMLSVSNQQTSEEFSSADDIEMSTEINTEPQGREQDLNKDPQSDLFTNDVLVDPKKAQIIKPKPRKNSLYLDTSREHTIWKPQRQERNPSDGSIDVLESRQDLIDRRKRLQHRVIATQEVLKVHREELEDVEEDEELGGVHHSMTKEGKKWQTAIKKVMESNAKAKTRKKYLQFHESVTQLVEMMSKSSYRDSVESFGTSANEEAPSSQDRKTVPVLNRRVKERMLKSFFSESNIPI